MSSKDILKMVTVVALMAVAGIVVIGYFDNKKVAIEAERAEHIRQIEYEESAISEVQRTERTEERAQFWQKLVPWGDDEAEDNDTDIDKPSL